MKKTMYMESQSTDPAFNLALEQYVFDSMPRDREYFWLWQNHNTIVVGKHQNTAEEINQAFVQEHGIHCPGAERSITTWAISILPLSVIQAAWSS